MIFLLSSFLLKDCVRIFGKNQMEGVEDVFKSSPKLKYQLHRQSLLKCFPDVQFNAKKMDGPNVKERIGRASFISCIINEIMCCLVVPPYVLEQLFLVIAVLLQ